MKRFKSCILFLSLLLLGLMISDNIQAGNTADNKDDKKITPKKLEKIYHPDNYKNDFEPGTVIVKLKSAVTTRRAPSSSFLGIDVKKAEELAVANKAEPQKIEKNSDSVRGTELILTLERDTKQAVLDAIDILKENPDVAYAQPNYLYDVEGQDSGGSSAVSEPVEPKTQNDITATPNDPRYSELWGMQKINMPSAWDLSKGSANVKVGVLDTGIDYNHTDLAVNVYEGLGYNFYDFTDNNGHGTHVAGTIGAKGNNSLGVVGVNWNTYIVPVKIGNENSSTGTASDSVTLRRALMYSENIGLHVVNVSYSFFDGGQYDILVEDGLNYFSGIVVGAAGNSNSNYNNTYNCDNLILVGNSTQSDGKASDSSYGEAVDIFAPGTSILSTIPGNGYGFMSGTSMAAPHVTGAAALLKAYKPSSTNKDIKELICGTAMQATALINKCEADGILNVQKLLTDESRRIGDFSFQRLSGHEITITYYHGSNLTVIFPSVLGGYNVTELGTPPSAQFPYGAPVVSTAVTHVIMPDSVNNLGVCTFLSRTSLQYVYLSANLNYLPFSTFNGCSSLTDVVLPNNLETIGTNVFLDCTSLRNITLPNSVVTIQSFAFDGCTSLQQISLSSQLREIWYAAFIRCSSLQSITIPSSVERLEFAFPDCSSLDNVRFMGANPPAYFTSDTFDGCRLLSTIYVPWGASARYRSLQFLMPYRIVEI